MKRRLAPPKKLEVDVVVLETRYWVEGETLAQLAQAYGVSEGTIRRRMDAAGIPVRLPAERKGYRWARKWRKCRECGERGTGQMAHHGLGFCCRCYGRLVEYPRFKRRRGVATSKKQWRGPRHIKDNAANCPDFGSLYCANECDAKLEFADQIEGIDFCDPDNCRDCPYSEPCPCFDEERIGD